MGKRKAVASAALAASLTLNQFPFADLSITAGAVNASSTRESIALDVFKCEFNETSQRTISYGIGISCHQFTDTTGVINRRLVYGAIDPRITGTFKVYSQLLIDDKAQSAWTETALNSSYRYELSYDELVEKANGDIVDEYHDMNIKIEYTPSKADIENGVKIIKSGNAASNGTLYDSNSGFGSTPVAGKKYTFTAKSMGIGLALGDMYQYISTGGSWVANPISKFASSSVTKKYKDAAFSAGFTTDSNGAVTYKSSNTNVATIAANGTITILKTGTTTITATTAATSIYNASTTTMSLTVDKATPTISGLSASNITYGQTLASSKVTATVKIGSESVPGSWVWSAPTTAPNVGTSNYALTFVPTDTVNIANVTARCDVTVDKSSDYTIDVKATEIRYGDLIRASKLIKTSSIDGQINWDAPDTRPQAGVCTAAWTFVPTSSNYESKHGTIDVVVNKGELNVDITNISPIEYGQTLDNAVVTGTATYKDIVNNKDLTISGKFEWVNGSTIKPSVSDSGTTEYTLQFIPTSSDNFATYTTQRTVTVTKSTTSVDPSIASLSATAITYGQSLGESVISANSDLSIPGKFEWVDKSVKPSVADSGKQYAVRFVPTDTTNYSIVEGLTCTINVNKAIPSLSGITVSATGLTYGQTLADSTLSGSTPIAGRYEWVDPTTVPTVSSSNITQYYVVFVPADEANYNRVKTSVTVSVIKATPVITDEMKASITATGLIYGNSLADSILTGKHPVLGDYVWDEQDIQPDVADSDRTSYAVSFIPSDSDNYNSVSGLSCKVVVEKATPNITGDMEVTLTASAITYGERLGNAVISGDMPVSGRYEWADPDEHPLVSDSGTTRFDVIFVPDDQTNYNVVTGLKCKLTVNKAAPEIDLASIQCTGITYGQTLVESTISGRTAQAGHFEWEDGSIAPSVSDSETTNYFAVFVPDDEVNYIRTRVRVNIKVDPLTPTVTDDMIRSITASGITYEQTLGDSVLTGTTPIPGTYKWADERIKPSVSDSNAVEYEVVFVPDDSVNYTTVSGLAARLEVSKATPVISSDIQANLTASAITYGQKLSDSVVSGDTPLAGHWAWLDSDITPTVSDSNTTDYVLTFVPLDSENYNTASTMLRLVVNKAVLEFDEEMVSAADISYGDTLADSVLVTHLPIFNGAEIPGSFAWADSSIAPDAGDREYEVIFTPDDTVNFETVRMMVPITVHQIEPVIPNEIRATVKASDITYGDTLADAIITGDTVISGHYEWADSSIKPGVIDSESTAYDIKFVPDDPNYASVTLSVVVKVNRAVPVISADILGDITVSTLSYGQKLSESVLSGATPAAGKYVWESGDTVPTVLGENNYMVVFMPTDSVNYESVNVGLIHVNVEKSDPQLTEQDWLSITPGWLTYGQSLAESAIYNDSSIPGRVTWVDDTIVPEVADSQRTEYEALFVPDDADNYNMVRLKLKITVHKALPKLSEDIMNKIVIKPIQYGMSLGDAEITCGDEDLHGKFVWTDATIKPEIADSDVTEYSITFVPDDTGNYENLTFSKTVHVDKRIVDPTVDPTVYINTIDSISAKAGMDVTYDISKMIRISDWTAAGKSISDPKGIIDGNVLVQGGQVSFKIKKGAALSTADLVFTISSKDYDDFDFTLKVIVDECNHSGETHLRGKVDATWENAGYTGDLVCDTCGVTLKYGEIIPALKTECKHEHTHVEGYKAATKTEAGYTGNVICDDCGILVKSGDVIEPKDCKHTKTHIEGYKAATTTAEGYTGNVICDECGEVVKYGTVIARLKEECKHTKTHVEGHKEATTTEEGYTGNIVCDNCGEVVKYGTVIERVEECKHAKTHVEGYKAPTKTAAGFSGNVVCDSCGAVIKRGEILSPVNEECKHAHTHLDGYVEATCQKEGYGGNTVCDDCGIVIKYGKNLPKKDHTPITVRSITATCTANGYTGDTVCSVCGEFISRGSDIPSLDHIEDAGTVVALPTTTTAGRREYHCTECGAFIRSEIIPMLESETDDTTSEAETHVHNYGTKWHYNDWYHWHECKQHDGAVGSKAEHEWDDGVYLTATCTSAGTVEYTCKVCGAVSIREESGGHRLSDYIYDDGAHYRICLECGKRFDEHVHTFGKWVPVEGETDEYKHVCSTCQYAIEKKFDSDPNDMFYDGDDADIWYPIDGEIDATFEGSFETEDVNDVSNDGADGDKTSESGNPYTGTSAPKKALISALTSGIGAAFVWRFRKKDKPDKSDK